MFEGFDWQAILVAAIALLSLINGLSVLQNTLSDRPKLHVEPVDDADWMWWSQIIDESGPEPVRRYVVIGNLTVMNIGRRPTSVAKTEMRIGLQNRETADSGLYTLPRPEVIYSSTETQRPTPVVETGIPEDTRLVLQSGEASSGLHCFLFGMYGSEEWAPRIHDGLLWGALTLTDVFGKTFDSKLGFRYVEFAALEGYFPTLRDFVIRHLDDGPDA
ncbi:MAG: hypothetical protein WBF53_00630 [Litorimonas sp.]